MPRAGQMFCKDKSTPENRAFWEHVEKIAAEVRKWPDWKRSLDPIGDMGKQKDAKQEVQ